MTAAELMARLEADPAYVARRAEKEAYFAAKVAQYRAEQSDLLRDLQAVGWPVSSVRDLVNTSQPYPEAVPILLSHLAKPYSDRTREGIARALAVRDAASAWPILRAEYEAAPDKSGFKDGPAVALSGASTDSTIGQLADLAKDRRHGSSRLLLLLGLKRSRCQIARETLAQLKDDPDLAKGIASWRRKV